MLQLFTRVNIPIDGAQCDGTDSAADNDDWNVFEFLEDASSTAVSPAAATLEQPAPDERLSTHKRVPYCAVQLIQVLSSDVLPLDVLPLSDDNATHMPDCSVDKVDVVFTDFLQRVTTLVIRKEKATSVGYRKFNDELEVRMCQLCQRIAEYMYIENPNSNYSIHSRMSTVIGELSSEADRLRNAEKTQRKKKRRSVVMMVMRMLVSCYLALGRGCNGAQFDHSIRLVTSQRMTWSTLLT